MLRRFGFKTSYCLINTPFFSGVVKTSMMSCSKSYDESKMDVSENFPPVYILSRIFGLFEAMEASKVKYCPKLLVKKIELPGKSDSLNITAVQLENVEILLADPKLLAKNYQLMPNLKWAHCTWAGIEPIFEVIKEKPGFILTRHSDVDFCEQMAEFIMAQVLICEKKLFSVWEGQQQRNWEKMSFHANIARNRRLRDLTLAVLGVGNMGMSVALYFKLHQTNLIGFARTPKAENECGFFDSIETSLEDVLPVADYIINTLPSTPQTAGLLNGVAFKVCKRKPVFINVGRGNIINECSLIEALKNGWLSHAVLDVFETEPLPTESKLWAMPDLITISPHCAAISEPMQVARDFFLHYGQYIKNEAFAKNHIVDWANKY